MQQTQNQPLYAAKDRVPFNLTLVLALGIAAWGAGAIFGLWDMGGNPSLIFLLGIAVAIYTWLFTPREYLVYSDALCVAYGRPRVKAIHFSNIASVEMGSMAAFDQLRVRPIRGRRQSIRVRDPETFFDQLEAALNDYRAANPEEGVDVYFTGRFPPEVVEGESESALDAEPASPPAEEAPQPESEAPQPAAGEPEGQSVEPDSSTATLAEAEPAEASQGTADDEGDDAENPPNQGQRGFY